ncbi:hypothetical protein DFP73DRAFT_515875 [Morchella snyderi]|nr:hypothetical protein DFP73DRAFT_515875 [Morchella snyderi]
MGPKNRKPNAKAPVTDTAIDTASVHTAAAVATDAAAAAAVTGAGAGSGADTSNRVPKVKAKPKSQYHHIIPRFILRKFVIEGQKKLNETSKSKNPEPNKRWKSATPGPSDHINCYHVSSGTFSISSIDTSYGVTDLYINIKNSDNVYEVEKKLSALESHAAQSISLLLKTVESRPPGDLPSVEPQYFKIKRKYLNYLRKFMFIMHFRNDGPSAQHFNEHYPDNSIGAAWIRAFRKKHNLEPLEMWLHVLKQFLDTPHMDLVDQGEKAIEQLGPGGMGQLLRGIDPDVQGVEMIAYCSEANNYFLAVWEAADGEEFIISNNSFGVWDSGHVGSGFCKLHQFYVISPRIAIVLCRNWLRPDIPPVPEFELMYRNSMFWGAPHRSPRVTKDGQIVGHMPSVAESYEEDNMNYEIVKLSTEFTHLVNAVIMGNIRINTGTITFRTPAAMLRTLDAYSKNMNHDNHHLYQPLVEQLLRMTGVNSSAFRVIPNPNPTSRTYRLAPPPEAVMPDFWETNLALLDMIEAEGNTELSEAFKKHMKKLIEQAALKFPQTPGDINPKPARLKRNMSDDKCAHVFAAAEKFMGYSDLEMLPVFRECTMIAFLRWLLAERRYMFELVERELAKVPMMEWVYDEPDSE